MRKYFLIILNLVVIACTAQTVFLQNIGTKWHYSFGNFVTGNQTNHKIEYVSDSISVITGEKIQKLIATKIYSNDNSSNNKYVLIKQRNDSVWFRHSQTNNTWQLLINYNAIAGQTWTYSVMSGTYANTYNITVNAVSTITLNNQSLKELNVTSNSGTNTYTTAINERIGFMNFLFNSSFNDPSIAIDGAYLTYFLCYEDSTLGLKQFTSKPCNYTYYVGLKENNNISMLNIYPNPTSGILILDAKNFTFTENYSLKIMNLLGQDLIERKFEKSIDISNLKTGIYFLQLYDNGNLIGIEKIIKE